MTATIEGTDPSGKYSVYYDKHSNSYNLVGIGKMVRVGTLLLSRYLGIKYV